MEDSEVDADYSSVLDAPPADAGAYSIATGVLGDGPEQYTLNTAPAGAPHTGQIAAVLMQQALAAASVVASLVLVLLSIALGAAERCASAAAAAGNVFSMSLPADWHNGCWMCRLVLLVAHHPQRHRVLQGRPGTEQVRTAPAPAPQQYIDSMPLHMHLPVGQAVLHA